MNVFHSCGITFHLPFNVIYSLVKDSIKGQFTTIFPTSIKAESGTMIQLLNMRDTKGQESEIFMSRWEHMFDCFFAFSILWLMGSRSYTKNNFSRVGQNV